MDYRCVTNVSELQEYISGYSLIGFDIETSPDEGFRNEVGAALDPHNAHITGISFSVKEDSGVYVPVSHKSGSNMPMSDFIPFITSFLRNKSIIKVAHNLAFESSFFYGLGIVVMPPVYDTIIASQLTVLTDHYRTLEESGLKTLVPDVFEVTLPTFDEVTQGRHFDELDPTDAETVRYACADSDYALRLYHIFNRQFSTLDPPQHRFITEQVESPAAIYTGIMRYNGMLVDKDLMLRKQAEAEKEITSIKEKIAFIIGDVNIGSDANTMAFKKYLYQELKLPELKVGANTKKTAPKKKPSNELPSADEEVMILLGEWCKENRPEIADLFPLILQYRKWGKAKSTYIDGYLKHINPATGRIHPNLLQMGTKTGRFSCEQPNMQNCPRAGKEDMVGVRDFIIAPEGKVLVSVDLSQIELRVGAFYCRDEAMLETYRTGGDIHAMTTSVIYHIPFEQAIDKNAENYKERRSIAKSCNFGVFYGLYPNGLQRNLKTDAGLDVSLEECEKIISNLKHGYPKLPKWQEKAKKEALSKRGCSTFLGRNRKLPGINSRDWGLRSYNERCALNTPIQGTAADILKLSMGRIIAGLQEREWLKPLLQIHDELVFEVPEDKVSEAVLFIKACMEAQPFPEFDIPILAEASVGKTFGKLHEWEEK